MDTWKSKKNHWKEKDMKVESYIPLFSSKYIMNRRTKLAMAADIVVL